MPIPVTPPTLPQATVSAIPPDALGGSNPTCTALDDLRAKIAALGPGDTLTVEGGHTFSISATNLPLKAQGAQWTAIRGSAEAQIAAAGTRINPAAHASFMPKIQGPQNQVIQGNDNTYGWRFVGIEFVLNPAWQFNNSWAFLLATFGWNQDDINGNRTTPAHSARAMNRVIIERCYWHARPDQQLVKHIYNNCNDFRLCDSVLVEVHATGQEASTVNIIQGGRTQLYENNQLEGAGQCLFFGGSNVYQQGEQPQDITIRRNWLRKLRSWNQNDPSYGGFPWVIKPTLETKYGQRYLIEGNTMEDSFGWPPFTADAFKQYTAQDGIQVTLEDVTFQHNWLKTSCGMLQFWPGTAGISRLKFYNNLGTGIAPFNAINYATNKLFYIGSADGSVYPGTDEVRRDIWIEHNTVVGPQSPGGGVFGDPASQPWAPKIERIRVRNNVTGYGNGGYSCEGYWTNEAWAFDICSTDRDLSRNAMYAPTLSSGLLIPYNQNNWNVPDGPGQFFIVGTPSAAGLDITSGQLLPGSPLKAGGLYEADDHTDNGVNFPLLNSVMGGQAAPTLSPPVITGVYLTGDTLVHGTGLPGATVRLFRDGVPV